MKTIYTQLQELETLRFQISIASTEAQAGNEALTAKHLKSHISALYRKSKEVYATFSEYVGLDVERITANQVDLHTKVLKSKYANISNKIVYKPLAFTGDILAFTELLTKTSGEAKKVHESINASIVLFSGFLTNVEELTKVNATKLPPVVNVEDELKSFKLFFGGAEGVDRDTLGNLYRNLRDYRAASDNIIDLSKDFKGHNVKTLRVEADKLYAIMGHLEKELDAKNVKLSPAAANSIGNCLYSTSETLAFYSLYITKLIAVSQSQRDTADKLNSLI